MCCQALTNIKAQMVNNTISQNCNFYCWNIYVLFRRALRRSFFLYVDGKWEYPGDIFWKICLAASVIGFLFLAVCYHMIFAIDYRPGYSTMPFVWLPITKYLGHFKTQSNALTNLYTMNFMAGLSTIFDKQKIWCLHMLHRPLVFLYKPETVEMVLGNSKFIKKGYEYKVFNPLLREGLFTSKGRKWVNRRKLLTQTFHFKILQDFLPVLQEKSENIVSKLDSLLDEPWIEVEPLMHSCSLDVILQTAMGVKFDAEDKEIVKCIDAVKKGISYCIQRMTAVWLLPDIIFKMSPLAIKTEKNNQIIRNFVSKVLNEKKAALKLPMNSDSQIKNNNEVLTNGYKKKKKNKAFLDLLLDIQAEDNSFTEEDILEEVLTFFIAGFDTTGSALSYTLYLVGLYKDVQLKVHEELDKVFEDDREITREDLKCLKYLECVIKESIRLYPPVPYYSRCATQDFKVLDCNIKKGSSLIILAQMVHRDPDTYPNPEKFIPERFFPENSAGRHPFAYLPFSAGARNCIGQKFALMELKTIIANILRKFSISSLDERDKILGIESIGKRCGEPLRMKFSHRIKNDYGVHFE